MNGCKSFVSGLVMMVAVGAGVAQSAQQPIDLATSKQLLPPAPGRPQRVNSLPLSLAASPDGRWVVVVNAGYGTWESHYAESLAVMNTRTGTVQDFPDVRMKERAKQTYFSGLAFSPDGSKVYASVASITVPEGDNKGDTGNGVAVFDFAEGVLKPVGFLKLPLVKLAAGRATEERKGIEPGMGVPYPAAIEVVRGNRLLVAENLADAATLIDVATGKVLRSFDLSEVDAVPATYPIAVAATADGKRAFVALWNSSEVAELDLERGVVVGKIALLKPARATDPGSHPCSLVLDERAGLLYVALSNRDSVGVIGVGKQVGDAMAVRGYFDTRLPGQTYFGAEPDALALSADRSRLYVANMASDAIAVIDTHKLRNMDKARGMVEPMGFVPTEMMPMALESSGGKLFVASGRGKGTGPNDMPQRESMWSGHGKEKFTYAPTLDYGSLAEIGEESMAQDLKASTAVVMESNRMKASNETLPFAGGTSPIKHVIYIIKENRTYDQIFGDLAKDGRPVGNGDAALAMYGEAITPNQHKLALQFGVLDNFYDSGEVSGEGHVWSNAAIGTDYLEKTWQIDYRGAERPYDYEGIVANGYPLLQHIADVAEPATSYIWTNFAAHGMRVYHFGEYIGSTFCGTDAKKKSAQPMDPKQGTTGATEACARPYVRPGELFPADWGGGKNLWAYNVPRLASNTATKPELVGHFAQEYPDFNLDIPDQVRVEIFLRHLKQWEKDRAAGNDTMPNYIQLRLPNDHTAGTRPGEPSPKSSIADNDLAVGRAVEAISHSAYWEDTAFFILEDDAQNGADHVDAHRSTALVVSKYAPHAKAGAAAFVDSTFYSTVSMLRTMETVLGLPPMNNNDAFSSMIGSLLSGPGDQPAFDADTTNRDNRLIYTANTKAAPGAAASARMDFSREDRAPVQQLNLILWQATRGSTPPPAMLFLKVKQKDDD